MESAQKQVRAILPLLKAPITNITDKGFSILLGAQYGSPTTIKVVQDMAMYDVREGDVVTLYTEIMLKPAQGTA